MDLENESENEDVEKKVQINFREIQEKDYRGLIALTMTVAYFILLGVCVVTNNFEGAKIIAAILGPPFGFAMAYYFKGGKE